MSSAETHPTRPGVAEPDQDGLNNRLFFRLMQCANLYEREVQRKVGISGVQGAVLGALCRDVEGGMPFSEIVRYLAVSRQNLTTVLNRLERLGLVERIEGQEDRRQRIVRITERGQKHWDAVFADALGFYVEATQQLAPGDREKTIDLLSRISRSLKAMT